MAVLWSGTIFLSAFLLFLVQPMMAKMILPLLGELRPSGTLACCFIRVRCWAGMDMSIY